MTEPNFFDIENLKKSMRTKGRIIPLASIQATIENSEQNKKRDTKYLHPSEICKRDWCPRASMYEILGYEKTASKEHSFQTLNIFHTGHDIHAKWQGWLERAGVLAKSELPIFDEEHHIMGHADGLINDLDGEAILEIKSIGAGTIRMENFELHKKYTDKEITHEELWNKIRQPFYTHLRQLNLYMFVTGVHTGVFLYEWKATQACKEFEVKYQPTLIEPILSACALVKKSLDEGTIIARPVWADIAHKNCKKCPFKTTCWKEDNSGDRQPISPDTLDARVFEKVSITSTTSGTSASNPVTPRRLIRH